jgi:SMODS and SLOG-associating 2TM effector domain 2
MFAKQAPIEDPSKISKFTAAIVSLKWTHADIRTSLDALFQQISALVQAEIQYYYDRRRSSRRLSQVCRFVAWVLATAGALVPVIHPILGPEAPGTLLWWGYAAFGLAGAVMVADALFAGTQAHHRYTAAQLEIERIYSVFAMKWHAALIKLEAHPTAEAAVAAVELAEAFIASFHKAMGTETAGWKKDVSDGLSQLKGKIDAGSKGP